MRLIFSEASADYTNYVFPYVVWAFPEPGEPASTFFERGFLPSPNRDPPRYYLCRSVRVDLTRFRASSENRRILRKAEAITHRLIPRASFDFTDRWQQLCLEYAKERFGDSVMPPGRLRAVLDSGATTHVLTFHDTVAARDVGMATLFCDPPTLVQYHFAFYDLAYFRRSLGMAMMTRAVELFQAQNYRHIYLGSCYSRAALYKTQYEGVEWFDGAGWSTDLEALKFVIERGASPQALHLYEADDYLHRFHGGAIHGLVERSPFTLREPVKR